MTYFTLPELQYQGEIMSYLKPKYIKEVKADNIVLNKTLALYLTKIKNEIDSRQTEWDKYKKYINPYEYIHTSFPGSKVSVCRLKPISRAFFKFVEIYYSLELYKEFENETNNIFFLAEGPGGFIEALDYVRNNTNDNYYTITLLDDDIGIPGWKKSLNVNNKVNFENGIDNRGDLFNIDTYKDLYDKYHGTMNLVTADGGFNFSSDFNNQENVGAKLIMFEVFYGLMLQKKGGTFIIKFYDTFSQISLDIIYLLMHFYTSVVEIKPCSSRYANSEKYIVCRNYRHVGFEKDKFIEIMENVKDNNIESLFSFKIPYYVLSKLEEYNAIFGQQQLESIVNTLSIISNCKSDKLDVIKKQNIIKCINWCIKYKLPHNHFSHNSFNIKQ